MRHGGPRYDKMDTKKLSLVVKPSGTLNTTKALVIVYANYSKLLLISYLPTQNLLSHAEAGEDGVEDFCGGNLTVASDFRQVGEDESEIFGHQVCRQLGVENG